MIQLIRTPRVTRPMRIQRTLRPVMTTIRGRVAVVAVAVVVDAAVVVVPKAAPTMWMHLKMPRWAKATMPSPP
jgi:hypothetical protein